MLEDSLKSNTFKMLVNVDLGERVKIKDIDFEGNKIFSDKKLRSQLKKTKKVSHYVFGKNLNYLRKNMLKTNKTY